MQETLHDPTPEPAERGEPSDLVGQVLDGRYALERKLGAGGMGVVYAARHVVLGTRLAIKVLRPPPAAQADEAVERFRREARAASALGHPNIVDVRDFGTLPGGLCYYVMEQLEGVDLLDEIEKSETGLPVQRVAHIGRQIAEALGAAHQQSIVHRDLKPENVFLTTRHGRPDHVKLIDFGIAKVSTADAGLAATLPPGKLAGMGLVALAASPSGGRFTAAGVVLGTPVYMSPEQCSGRDVDSRSDLYALGVLLFEATTGRAPFDGDSVFEIMRQHQHEAPPDPRTLRPDLSGELAELILHCLEKDPAKRPMGMHEVAERLALLVPPVPVEASGTFSGALVASVAPPVPDARTKAPPPTHGPKFSTQPGLARVDRARPARASGPTAAASLPVGWLVAGAVAVIGVSIAIGLALGARSAPTDPSAVAAPAPAPAAPPAPAPSVATTPPSPPVTTPSTATPTPTPTPTSTATPSTHRTTRHPRPPPPTAAPEIAPPPPEPEPEPEPAPARTRPRPTDAVRDPWSE